MCNKRQRCWPNIEPTLVNKTCDCRVIIHTHVLFHESENNKYLFVISDLFFCALFFYTDLINTRCSKIKKNIF